MCPLLKTDTSVILDITLNNPVQSNSNVVYSRRIFKWLQFEKKTFQMSFMATPSGILKWNGVIPLRTTM